MIPVIIVAIIAYLIGSVNFSVIISKKIAGFDVREKGSGNAGTTNMLRSVGKGAAVVTLVCDILKGVVAVMIGLLISQIVKNTSGALLVQTAGFAVIVRTYISNIFWIQRRQGNCNITWSITLHELGSRINMSSICINCNGSNSYGICRLLYSSSIISSTYFIWSAGSTFACTSEII